MAFVSIFTAGDPVTFIYTPTAQAQVSGIVADFRGANNYRPNLIGDPYGDRDSTTSYFNRAAFAVPDPSQPFGNAGRNIVRGPNFWQVDFALQKHFRLPVGPNTRIEVRGEAFNLLNRVNFRPPVGNISATNFGSFTTHVRSAHHPARRPRQLLSVAARWNRVLVLVDTRQRFDAIRDAWDRPMSCWRGCCAHERGEGLGVLAAVRRSDECGRGAGGQRWTHVRLSQPCVRVPGESTDARSAFDVLVEMFDPRFVGFELDVFWASMAGLDPVTLHKESFGASSAAASEG